LLSDAITGVNARAFMLATVNPAHPAETLSTLQYAQRYSSIKSNQEEINKSGASVTKTLRVVQMKRAHLSSLLKDNELTRQELTARRGSGLREKAPIRHLFEVLSEVEEAEAQLASRKAALQKVKNEDQEKKRRMMGLE
jgi:hypothetical protein